MNYFCINNSIVTAHSQWSILIKDCFPTVHEKSENAHRETISIGKGVKQCSTSHTASNWAFLGATSENRNCLQGALSPGPQPSMCGNIFSARAYMVSTLP